MYYKPTKFNENRWSHFLENLNFLFFSQVNNPEFPGKGGSYRKTRDIFKRTLDIEFERHRSIYLGSTIGDVHTDTHTDRERDIFSKILF